MNKSGKILLLETDTDLCTLLTGKLRQAAGKNEVLCFSDITKAEEYLHNHVSEVFLVLQNNNSPRLHLTDSRNMVYMHEKFNVENIAYIFLVQSKEESVTNGIHTFIHCYYKPEIPEWLPENFESIIAFWKEHLFPARFSGVQFR
jgi:hypothetical protein